MASMDLSKVNRKRFWEHVDFSQGDYGCWLWTGSVNGKGYGTYGHWMAHRLAWTLLKGPIPPGMTIDHTCRTQLCVNPRHFDVVTRKHNNQRGRAVLRGERR